MRAQKTPFAAAIFDFSEPNQPSPEHRDEALHAFMRHFGPTFASHVRQTDIALKYGPHSLAVIMPGTNAKQAGLMVEKMRKLASAPHPGAQAAPMMSAGIAEAVQDGEMDAADIVTVLINRVESALEQAQAIGGNVTKVLDPPSLPH